MKLGYVDTSFLVSLAFAERSHRRRRRQLGALDRVFSSTLLEAELTAAARREGVGDEVAAFLAPVSWVYPQRRLTPEIERVLEVGYLRGADLHHLATALYLFPTARAISLLTLDQRQASVGAGLGFTVRGPD